MRLNEWGAQIPAVAVHRNTKQKQMGSAHLWQLVAKKQHKYKYKYKIYKDTNANTQIRIHKYEYTNMNTQIKIHKYKYTNTNRMHCGVAVGCQKKQRKWAMAAMRVTNGCTPSRAHRGKPGPHLIWQQCDTIFSLCGLSVLIQIQIQYKYIVIQVCVLSAGL